MPDFADLDVLVVYSSDLALSASVKDSYSRSPFLPSSKQANYNSSYEYFLQTCESQHLRAGLTASVDVTGPGTCSDYWTSQAGEWVKMHARARSRQIFDKISLTSPLRIAERQLMLSDTRVKAFNDGILFDTFCDKLLTYRRLPAYSVPTVNLASSKLVDVERALARLRALLSHHPHPQDFSKQLVLKDRFGLGGNFVYKISSNFAKRISQLMISNKQVRFVLQPFLLFSKGYTYHNQQTATDLRLIFHHDQLLQCYVRMAKARDFRCNEHQGGQLEYVTAGDIPDLVHRAAAQLVASIKSPQSLYALDFLMSDSGRVYFIEGNIGPGIDWDASKKVNEEMSKQLIESIVEELRKRVELI